MKAVISLSLCLLFLFIFIFIIFSHEKPFRYRLETFEQTIKPKGNIRVLSIFKYNLNKKGEIINQIPQKYTYQYDSNGYCIYGTENLNNCVSTKTGEVIFKKIFYKNNEQGKPIVLIDSFSNGKFDQKFGYKYDEKGNQIEFDEYYPNKSHVLSKVISKYDEQGNHEDYYYGITGDAWWKYTYKLNNKGNLIEWKNIIHNTEVVGSISAKYDSDGNIVEEDGYMVYEGENHRKLTYKYEGKDAAGNWLKRTAFKNDKPFEIVERKIEYY